MRTFLLCLILCVPAFAQDSMSTEDVTARAPIPDEATVTVAQLSEHVDLYAGYQVIQHCTLLNLDWDRSRQHWEGRLLENRASDDVRVICSNAELGKRIHQNVDNMNGFRLTVCVIVRESDSPIGGWEVDITRLDVYNKDGSLGASFN